MIRLYLEHFLIHMLRRYSNPMILPKSSLRPLPLKATKKRSDIELFNRVVDYLEAHLDSHVTIEQICREKPDRPFTAAEIFREQSSLGIIEYFLL